MTAFLCVCRCRQRQRNASAYAFSFSVSFSWLRLRPLQRHSIFFSFFIFKLAAHFQPPGTFLWGPKNWEDYPAVSSGYDSAFPHNRRNILETFSFPNDSFSGGWNAPASVTFPERATESEHRPSLDPCFLATRR